jgi:TPR repeat protein
MFKRLLLAAMIALPLIFTLAAAAQVSSTASENAKTRLNKQEVIDLMIKAGRMPAQQQSNKLDSIWKDLSASKTPRSDFLFCAGLAYLGNCKAQRCVASAYENGIGIVDDLSEAYSWYGVALENRISDKAAQELLEADTDRVKQKLLANYPHPTEDDLDDLVRAQKSRIAQYQEEAKKARK